MVITAGLTSIGWEGGVGNYDAEEVDWAKPGTVTVPPSSLPVEEGVSADDEGTEGGTLTRESALDFGRFQTTALVEVPAALVIVATEEPEQLIPARWRSLFERELELREGDDSGVTAGELALGTSAPDEGATQYD